MASTDQVELGTIPTDWALLLVGGFGEQCFKDMRAFADGADHLKKTHGIDAYRIDVEAFGSSEDNAKLIEKKVLALLKVEPERRFIAVTHSKGAADFMVALSSYPESLESVEALITVAGAVGGSWLANDLGALNDQVIKKLKLPTCMENRALLENGLDSMRRDNRQKFLAEVPHNWKGYSISAVSSRGNTSNVLTPFWDRLAPYALEQDTHILEREAMMPGGKFLGRALGDHWAVAMPFDPPSDNVSEATKRLIKVFVNHNRYPRAAILESAVRIVTTDLK